MRLLDLLSLGPPPRLERPQIGKKGSPFVRLGLAVEVDSVCGSYRRHHARWLLGLDKLVKLDVVIDNFFQSRRAVVVEVRRRMPNAVEARDIQLVPVISGWLPSNNNESG